jgi:hypothetical protein
VLWNYSRAASLYYSQLLSVGFGGTGYVVFAWNTGAANRAINSGAQVVSSNADYWIVGTFAASNQKAYVNGAQVASGTYADTISYPASPGPVYVSRYIHNEAFVVPISISELLWFDRALTASDVSAYLADVNDGTTCGLWAEPRRFVPVWVAGGNRRRRVFSGACV